MKHFVVYANWLIHHWSWTQNSGDCANPLITGMPNGPFIWGLDVYLASLLGDGVGWQMPTIWNVVGQKRCQFTFLEVMPEIFVASFSPVLVTRGRKQIHYSSFNEKVLQLQQGKNRSESSQINMLIQRTSQLLILQIFRASALLLVSRAAQLQHVHKQMEENVNIPLSDSFISPDFCFKVWNNCGGSGY